MLLVCEPWAENCECRLYGFIWLTCVTAIRITRKICFDFLRGFISICLFHSLTLAFTPLHWHSPSVTTKPIFIKLLKWHLNKPTIKIIHHLERRKKFVMISIDFIIITIVILIIVASLLYLYTAIEIVIAGRESDELKLF